MMRSSRRRRVVSFEVKPLGEANDAEPSNTGKGVIIYKGINLDVAYSPVEKHNFIDVAPG